MQQGINVGIKNVVELIDSHGVPVAGIFADGEHRRAVDADVDRAVLFERGGKQLVPGFALGGVADDRNGVAAGGHDFRTLFFHMGINVVHDDFGAFLTEKLRSLAADTAVCAGDDRYFIQKSVHFISSILKNRNDMIRVLICAARPEVHRNRV